MFGIDDWLIASTLASAGAGIWSANSAKKGQDNANRLSQESAREQMAFQERMSSTAHQREVDDLRKAGLNPILSANTGASTPGGAMGSFQSNQAVAAPIKAETFNRALSSAQSIANINLTKASEANTVASTARTIAETKPKEKMAEAIDLISNWVMNSAKSLGNKAGGGADITMANNPKR